jgi:Protein of unknown function (DUF2550)
MDATQVVGALLLLLVLAVLVSLVVRRVRLLRGGGVDVSLRRRADPPGRSGWHLGVGRYRGDELAWFRLTSLWPGPNVVVDRTDLEIVDRRPPTEAEVDAIPAAGVVLRCRTPARTLEMAMAPGVLTGFLAWLEATPPGRTGYRQAS